MEKALNTSQIRSVLNQIIPSTIKSDVYAADELKFVKGNQFAIVVNSDRAELPGQHWLAIYKDKNSRVMEFFDSFAIPIEFYDNNFVKFLRERFASVKCSNLQLQSLESECCGQFCLYFLYYRVNGYSFEDIIKSFSVKNYKLNDRIATNFVVNNFSNNKTAKLTRANCVQNCVKLCNLNLNKK